MACKSSQRGLSMLEVTLALSVSLVILAGVIYEYKQQAQEARIGQAKMVLATVRTGLSQFYYQNGRYPTAKELERNTWYVSSKPVPVITGIATVDYSKDPTLEAQGEALGYIQEPISNSGKVIDADSGGVPSPSSPGGWWYSQQAGTISLNVSSDSVGGQNPLNW